LEEALGDVDNIVRLPVREGLNAFDRRVVDLVEGLLEDFQAARSEIERSGLMVRNDYGDLEENPAAQASRRASAELRGWVKERPDLFGPHQPGALDSGPSRLEKYRKKS